MSRSVREKGKYDAMVLHAMSPPFKSLAYLYVGTSDFGRDVAYYRDVLGAELVWNLTGFGAHVAAFRVGGGPLLLLADHRPAPTCMPVFEVENLEDSVRTLGKRGWKAEGSAFEIPNGPCHAFEDPSQNRFAIFENTRPDPFGSQAVSKTKSRSRAGKSRSAKRQ